MMASADKDGNGEIDIEEFQGMMLATADGAAVWGKIRSHCATVATGESPEGELVVEAVLACVDVSAWLTQRGLGAGAGQILRSLAVSRRGAGGWLAELKSMSDEDLEAMAGLPSGVTKQEAYAPPRQPDFEEDL